MTITEQDIFQYISQIGAEAGINTTVWAVKMPSTFNMAVFGPMANVFDLRYNILNISKDGIIIIGVDNAGRLTPLHLCIPKNEIYNIKFKKKLMGYNVEIITVNGSLKYTINRVMIGSGFHKANFENVMRVLKEFKM